MDSRIEVLETKSVYQERLIQELNEVIIRQQNQIDFIEKTLSQMRNDVQGQTHGSEQEVPPPHY
ncbi:MAG TPA: SlyX family protein [Ghiorsea sp.]|nr:SlyX family protein [Ghiorsea sp.]HIP07417.1 SlyX family protein [Mariprofundaceae bacterium]